MNSLYYTEKEVAQLFQHKQMITNVKYRKHARKFGNRWYYLRKEIDAIINYLSEDSVAIAEKAFESFEYVDINLKEYVCAADALQITGRSRQRLSQVKKSEEVNAIKFDGFLWYCKSDLKNDKS